MYIGEIKHPHAKRLHLKLLLMSSFVCYCNIVSYAYIVDAAGERDVAPW